MLQKEIIIAEPWPFHLIASIYDGVLSRLRGLMENPARLPRADKSQRIQDFYCRWRGYEPEQAITDLSNTMYEKLLDSIGHSLIAESAENLKVLDIGCGRLTFFLWLAHREIWASSYTGIDIVIRTEDIAFAAQHNLILHEFDLESNVNHLPASQYDLIVAINVLPYVSNLKSFFELVARGSCRRTVLLIVDPIPSLYWETYFAGIQLKIRGPNLISDVAAAYGWLCCERHTLSLSALGGGVRFKISSAQIFKRAGPNNS